MANAYEFNSSNKGAVDSALDFPRLKLEKKGEKARLAIFSIGTDADGKKELQLPKPEGGYYFDLRIPGAEREYVGSFECLADEATKEAGGFDADACPHCAVVLAGNVSEDVMRGRRRKFVMPVIRYKTKGAGSDLVEPYSVEALAWRFGDRYFNVIVDEHEKWAESGGLLGHDITLTCDVVQFQNFTISVEPEAAYAKDRDLGKLVIDTFVNQTAGVPNGLARQLGSKLNAVDLEKKISETIQAAAQLGVGGPPMSAVPTVDPATVESLAADLLGSAPVEAVSTEAVQAAADVTVPDVQAEPETTAASGDAEVNFDEFFSGS